MADLDEARELVAQSCQIVGKMDLTREPAGHVSARIPGTDRIVIKARGDGEAALSYVTPDDLIICNLDGKKVEGRDDLAAPNEVFIHTEMYRARPDVNCVIHVHPPTVMLFTICNKELLPLYGAYDPTGLRLLLDGIPTYPRSILISSGSLGQDLAKAIGPKNVCLMRGHGITAVGPTIEEATITAWRVNDLAEINYRAALLGNPEPISDEDLEAFRNMGTRRTNDERAHAPSTTWRYLVQWAADH